MSTFSCPVVRIQKFGKNPNSDSLCIYNGPQGPLQFREGEINVGDLAVFVPADSLVPTDRPQFAFLAPKAGADGMYRIRGVRLRGVPSVGLLLRAPTGIIMGDGVDTFSHHVKQGDDMSVWYGIKKYEPPQTHSFHTSSTARPNPPGLDVSPTYDVENMWQFNHSTVEGTETEALDYESVWSITEKIHGCNFRIYMDGTGTVHVGSRSRWVSEGNVWFDAYLKYKTILDELLIKNPDTVFFGQVFGKVQDLHYSVNGIDLRLFDSYNTKTNRYNSIGDLGRRLTEVDSGLVLMVPFVGQFVGTLRDAIEYGKANCSGKSLLDGLTMRQGVVIRPVSQDLMAFRGGAMRLIVKVVSPEYLSRLNGTQEH